MAEQAHPMTSNSQEGEVSEHATEDLVERVARNLRCSSRSPCSACRRAARAIIETVADHLEDRYGEAYSEDLFPEPTQVQWARINDLLKAELGFPLDRVSGSVCRTRVENTVKHLRQQAREDG